MNTAGDWEAVRAQFPALDRWTHLNTATFGLLPRRAAAAAAAHFAHRDALACADFLSWFDDMDRLRALIARLIRCAPEDIAFVPTASSALAIPLSGIAWRPGDRIVTLRGEFPNNLYAPGFLAARGVECVESDWDGFRESVDGRTRLAVLSTVNYTTGFAPPLAELARFLRERGVLLFLDGTQSVGALPFDVAAVQPDLLAVHGYKWLLSPNGAGFLYVRPEIREWLPPHVVGWRSHQDWRNVDRLHHGAPELPGTAAKYEGGMLPFALLYAMEASVELILEIGAAAIAHRVLGLAATARDILRRHGAHVEDYATPIVAARFEGRDPSAIAAALKQRSLLVAARHGLLRVSPHFYNNEADLERLDGALATALR